MRALPLATALACAAPLAFGADDVEALKAELRRLTGRIEALEHQGRDTERALASERLSENEPELATRLKAVEFQTLSMQKQARQIEALEGITVGASLTGVAQKARATGSAGGQDESRVNYRGDISVTLPGGEMGDVAGRIFAHLRFGQGNGVGLGPTYTSTANSTAFQVGSVSADDSFGILAQAWYQLNIPLPRDGARAQSKEQLSLTFGKIDPFVFFDQNAAADDESSKFLNNVFVHNPLLDSGGDVGADRYGFAPGAIVRYGNERERTRAWGLSLGAFASGAGANFSGSPASPFVIAQADTAWQIDHLPGNYRAYLWRNGRGQDYDGVERFHAGWGMSIDQKVDDQLTLFGRYGHQVAGKVRFDRALAAGLEINGAGWGRAADALGIAFGALRTSGAFSADSATVDADQDGRPDFGYVAGGWEKQAELYYRYRVNSRFELSPDFQYLRNAGGNGAAGPVTVIGLRAKVGF